MELLGKKVCVVGLGASNLPVVRFLVKEGARVTVCDQKDAEALGKRYREVADLPVRLNLGGRYLDVLMDEDYDLVFLTPGMKKHLPEIEAARARGAEIWSEMKLFFHLCPALIAGITGTSGKTTTTTLVGEMLRASGLKTLVGGNIGRPLIEKVREIPASARVVLELSSFQLQLLDRSPQVGALLNISPNHLDIHRSMEEYVQAKANIWRFQGPGDAIVLNWDRPITREMAASCRGKVFFFSYREEVSPGAFVRDGRIVVQVDRKHEGEVEICSTDEIRLPGAHNVENVMAASILALLCGAEPGAIRRVATTFRGVEHRLELVANIGGVRYYNDSIATTPDRTEAALTTFTAPVILIAGGYDKHIGFDDLARTIRTRVKTLITLGVTAPKIEKAVLDAVEVDGKERDLKIQRVDSLEEAVRLAFQGARPGDVVLLSPACASYDMFRNFEERGQQFRRLVEALKKENQSVW